MCTHPWIFRIMFTALITTFAPSFSLAQITSGDSKIDKIIIPANAPEPVTFAASELQAYLKKSTGADLAILTGNPARGAFFISTSQLSPDAEKKAGGFTKETNRQFDRASIAEREGCVYMVGENPRSALYAVYDFLQDRLGIRFYGPGAINEIVPTHDKLELAPGMTFQTGSALEFRSYYATRNAQNHDYCAKNRINLVECSEDNVKEEVKRGLIKHGPGHAWGRFVPDKELFATHPEYFPMRDGKRVVTGKGACFSNPEVRRIFVEKAGDYLAKHPFWDVFALWGEDLEYPSYCDCPECAKKTTGEWYTTMINEVAPVVEKELPNGRFEFIAYHETENPPKSVMPYYKNGKKMQLFICVGRSREIFHPLAARVAGSAGVDDKYQAWRKRLAEVNFQGKVILGEYYNLCEMPNQGPAGRSLIWPMEVIQQDTRMYMKDGLDGLGDFICFDNLSFPTPFNVWSWLHMYSTPERPLVEMENDFYPAWFGAASEPMRQYMKDLRSVMYERTSPQNIGRLEVLGKKLDAIQAPAGDKTIERRINIVKVHYAYCMQNKRLFQMFINNDQAGWERMKKPCEDFFRVTHCKDLEGAMNIPFSFDNWWYEYFLKQGPEAVKGLAARMDLY